ncbi:MAG: divergent PAP2 family protein [Clostridiales bacterium]|mgnify:FL=1|jgi:acid phosphatase family membrane protein YuiD|uniref:divergent PAP2 family protein n=1 Tax=Clostridia TaxID=186801 RepID=UPI0018A9D394|nr:divergent PAP2 family protein [Clostridium sp. 1001270J_160509_D11]MDU1202342.1 divergent PAP2 family protein [Clostridiales bacterium]
MTDIFQNRILLISIFSCFLAQFIKIFTGKEKRIDFKRIIISGGMPSSHSSFVTSLAMLVGFDKGFASTEFAITAVFAIIVMYDASGVRRAVGKQAEILNQIVDDFFHGKFDQHKKLKELVGHTPKEVLFGALLGIIIGIVMS